MDEKNFSSFYFPGFASGIFAQVSKTINLNNSGTLFYALTTDELKTVTNFTLTGKIDWHDFKTMSENMPLLSVIDISGVTVVAYKERLKILLQILFCIIILNSTMGEHFEIHSNISKYELTKHCKITKTSKKYESIYRSYY